MRDEYETSRRTLVLGAGAVGAAGILAACGGGQAELGNNNPTTSAPRPSPTGDVLAKKSEVPVGGGKIDFADAIVITQPTAGRFVGFSAICPHQGCVVAKVKGDTIICSCHGSEFSVKDGSVKQGPARQPLEKVAIKIEGEEIKLA